MKKLRISNRVPIKYFVTSGVGESDIQIHTGSFDQALKDAGIENYNLMFYSSILPRNAKRIEKKEIEYGSVVECIAAITHSKNGERATAGLIMGWIYNKKTNEKVVGLVAEYQGKDDEETAKKILEESLNEMFSSRFDKDEYEIREKEIITRSIIPKKKYATAVVAICFVEYEIPVIE
jgi:arginine decarboxylase